MSVLPSQIRFYGSANMPDADGQTTGGAVAFSKKIFFTDISPNGTMDYVSASASDTAVVITLSARDTQGRIVTEAKTLTGTTKVAGAQTAERLLKGVVSGTPAVGTIAAVSHTPIISAHTAQAGSANSSGVTPALLKLQAGDGATVAVGNIVRVTNNSPVGVQFQLKEIVATSGYGTDMVAVESDWSTVPDGTTTYDVHSGFLFNLGPTQVTEVRRPFYNAAADVAGGVTKTFYEKIFAVNVNTTTAITGAAVSKQVDPSAGALQLALTSALNDTATITNRQTAPATGITAFTSGAAPQSVAVPSPQNLSGGAAPNAANAQGVWLSLALTAGIAPAKTSFTLGASGATV